MNLAVEEHWHSLLKAMGREDLRGDPRFADSAARVKHREETDALIAGWTQTFGKMEVFAIAKRHRIPLASVRDVGEVMHDPHMHERGMLEEIEHDEIGRVIGCVVRAGEQKGAAFSAGAALKNPKTHTSDSIAEALEGLPKRRRYQALNLLSDFAKPLIAAVNGHAVGIGCIVTSCCDLIV